MFWIILVVLLFLGCFIVDGVRIMTARCFKKLGQKKFKNGDLEAAAKYREKAYDFYHDSPDSPDWIIRGCIALLVLAIGCVVSPIIFFVSTYNDDIALKSTDLGTAPIYSLENSSNTTTSFVLGTGNVIGTDSYTYYVQTDQGLVRETIEADHAYIQMTDEKEPCVFKREVVYGKNWPFIKKFFVLGGFIRSTKIEAVFYVPEGTLLQQYNLNS